MAATIIRGNKHFPKVPDHPKCRVMTPPELLQEVASELMHLGEFDLAVALRDTAARWDEPYGHRPQIWASRVEAALEYGLDDLSRIRLDVVLEKIRKLNGSPAVFDPYELYALNEIFFTELETMVGGEVNMDKVDIARMELGPQEPPQDPRIFNRRQADGSFRPLSEFFAVEE